MFCAYTHRTHVCSNCQLSAQPTYIEITEKYFTVPLRLLSHIHETPEPKKNYCQPHAEMAEPKSIQPLHPPVNSP